MSQRVFPRINKPATSEYEPCGLPPGDIEVPPRPGPPVLPLQTGRTIVDLLDPDCWRLILDHLDVKNVVRSERVSRGWRQVVHLYLQGIKKYDIKADEFGCKFRNYFNYGHIVVRKTYDKYCKLQLTEKNDMHLNEVLRKVGPWATHIAVDCVHEGDFERVVQNCPRLEHLEIYTQHILPLELAANCKALRSVKFCMVCEESVEMLDDNYLGSLVANESIKELGLELVNSVTGRFLRNLRSPHLKTLEISVRPANEFELQEVYTAVEYLKDLTRLELNHMYDFSEAHLFLEKMPNLEYLSMVQLNCGDRATVVDEMLVDAISRLGRLRYLNLFSNVRASDALLAALARGCKDLRALDVGNCPGVTGRAVAELCAARAPTLCKLYMHANHNVSRADVLAIIQCYHDIQDISPEWLAEVPFRVKTDLLDLRWSGSVLYNMWNH